MARFTNGWVKIYRSVGEGDLVNNPILLALWVRLLTWATWKPSKVLWRGKPREVPPGTVVFGMNRLAEEWECSPDTISRWTRYLVESGRIAVETSKRGSLVTIQNWEIYQSQDSDDRTVTGQSSDSDRTVTGCTPALIEEEKKGRKKKVRGECAVALPPLAEIWNQNRGQLPGVRGCSKSRAAKADERWRENSDPDYWVGVVDRIVRSQFCNGHNNRGWKADFDFLIQPDTHHKVLEGKYDDRKAAPGLTGSFLDDPEIRAEVEGYERARREAMGNA